MSRIETVFTGDTRNIDRQLLQLNAKIDKYATNAARASDRAAKGSAQAWRANQSAIQSSMSSAFSTAGIEKQFGALGPLISRFGPLFAAAFSGREAIALADTFTRFEAKLINAKVAAEDMAAVQARLFDIARANGQEVVSLADLYGNMAMAADNLGMSQADIISATEGVAAAMRLSGSTTAQSSATILQLGQALSGGTVRAEEYNSMLENSPALVRAVAESSARWGGDLGKLRTEINAGTVSSQAWGQAIVDVSAKLKADAANAPLTVAAGFQNLQTSLIEFVGKTDNALGASERLGQALSLLGDNIDKVAVAIGAAALLLLARATPAMAAYAATTLGAGLASLRTTASAIAMASAISGTSVAASVGAAAMSRLNASMAFFGGPLGIAIAAIASAVIGLGMAGADTASRMAALDGVMQQAKSTLQDVTAQSQAASAASVGVRTGAVSAAGGVATLGNAASTSAGQLRDYAAAQREAALADIARQRATIATGRNRDVAQSRAGRRGNYGGQVARSPAELVGRMGNFVVGEATDLWTNGQSERERQQRIAGYTQADADLAAAEAAVRATPDTAYRRGGAVTTPTTRSGGGGNTRGGSTGPSAAEVAASGAQLVREANRTLANALATLADDAETTHQNNLEEIKYQAEDRVRAIQKQASDKQITDAAAAEAVVAVNATRDAQERGERARRTREVEEAALAQANELAQIGQSIARLDEDRLRNLAENADTTAERAAYETEAFSLYQTSEKAAFDARQAETRARLRLANQLTAEVEARLQAEATAFAGRQTSEAAGFAADQRSTNPFAKYVDATKDINARFAEVAADGLGSFEDGIVSAIMQTERLGDVFKNVAQQIVADLIRIAVQKAVIGPLANALGFGSGGGGLFSTVLGGAKKRAIGDRSTTGGLYRINEGGAEGIVLPRGSEIIPAGKMRGLATPKVSGGSTQVFNLTTNVQAAGAVMAAEFRQEIGQANVMAVQQALQMSSQDMMKAGRRRLK